MEIQLPKLHFWVPSCYFSNVAWKKLMPTSSFLAGIKASKCKALFQWAPLSQAEIQLLYVIRSASILLQFRVNLVENQQILTFPR